LLLAFLIAAPLSFTGTSIASSRPNMQKETKPFAPRTGLSIDIVSKTNGADFSPYISKLVESLMPHLKAHLPESASNGKKGLVTLQVQLKQDGSLAEGYPVAITGLGSPTSAEYKDMEAASIAAVRATAPYGPLPEAYLDPTFMLKMTFYFNFYPKKPTTP
jgi:outer membrane biosynthesis protein TonB